MLPYTNRFKGCFYHDYSVGKTTYIKCIFQAGKNFYQVAYDDKLIVKSMSDLCNMRKRQMQAMAVTGSHRC